MNLVFSVVLLHLITSMHRNTDRNLLFSSIFHYFVYTNRLFPQNVSAFNCLNYNHSTLLKLIILALFSNLNVVAFFLLLLLLNVEACYLCNFNYGNLKLVMKHEHNEKDIYLAGYC